MKLERANPQPKPEEVVEKAQRMWREAMDLLDKRRKQWAEDDDLERELGWEKKPWNPEGQDGKP